MRPAQHWNKITCVVRWRGVWGNLMWFDTWDCSRRSELVVSICRRKWNRNPWIRNPVSPRGTSYPRIHLPNTALAPNWSICSPSAGMLGCLWLSNTRTTHRRTDNAICCRWSCWSGCIGWRTPWLWLDTSRGFDSICPWTALGPGRGSSRLCRQCRTIWFLKLYYTYQFDHRLKFVAWKGVR